jgi:hypothetical protein
MNSATSGQFAPAPTANDPGSGFDFQTMSVSRMKPISGTSLPRVKT